MEEGDTPVGFPIAGAFRQNATPMVPKTELMENVGTVARSFGSGISLHYAVQIIRRTYPHARYPFNKGIFGGNW